MSDSAGIFNDDVSELMQIWWLDGINVGSFISKASVVSKAVPECIYVWERNSVVYYFRYNHFYPIVEDPEDADQILPSVHISSVPSLQLDTRRLFTLDSFPDDTWEPILVLHSVFLRI